MTAHHLLAVACLVLAATHAHAQPPTVHDLGLLPGDATVDRAVGSQQDHAVCRGGDQYLVVWADDRAQSVGGGTNQSGLDLFGIRLDAQGAPLDAAPFLLAGGMGGQRQPHVAWNGTAWLVLYVSQDPTAGYYEDALRAVRVSAAGAVLDAPPLGFPPTAFTPNTVGLRLAGQNGQWLVTRCLYHADGYGTYLAGQRLDANGTLLDTTPVVLLDWVYGGTAALTAAGEYLVAGPDWNNGATLKAQRVGQNGQPVGASFTVPSLNLASNGSEYYVAWIRDYVNLVGSRMSTTGTLSTPAGTPLVTGFSQYTHATLAHDGSRWWLEWGASDQLRTLRVSAAGALLDPVGGVLLPVTIGGNVNTAYAPTLASRAGGGVHLFWYDLRVALNYDANVFVLPIGPGNTAETERCVSTGTRSQRSPDLAAGPGGSAALAFVSEAANDRRLLVHLLGPDGAPTTPAPVEVARGTSIGRPGIAWNGSLYLVTWDGATGGDPALPVKARRLRADGTFVDAAPFDVMAGFSPDVEALGEDFLIAAARVHTYPQNIYAWMRIVDGPTGTFQNDATLLGGGYVNVGPRVHRDGTRWLVTYQSQWSHDNSASDAIYQFVSPNGAFTAPLNPSTTSGGAGTPDVAFSGARYLFVWRNNSLANANNYIAGRLMNADGSFATGNFVIAEAAGRQLRPVVDWDGTNFVVAWDDQRNQGAFFDERTDVYAARVSPAGVVLDAPAFPVFAGPHGDATATLLARADGSALLAAARFEVAPPFDSYRIGLARLAGEATLDVSGAATPSGVSLAPGAPNPFASHTTLTFDLPRNGPVELAILDVQGRRVRTLLAGEARPAGRHPVSWDGLDDAGRRLGPGVYLAVLRTESVSLARRLVLLER